MRSQDELEAGLIRVRMAQQAATDYIAHVSNCLNCDVSNPDEMRLCERGRRVGIHYQVAHGLAEPYLLIWKQETGRLVPAQA